MCVSGIQVWEWVKRASQHDLIVPCCFVGSSSSCRHCFVLPAVVAAMAKVMQAMKAMKAMKDMKAMKAAKGRSGKSGKTPMDIINGYKVKLAEVNGELEDEKKRSRVKDERIRELEAAVRHKLDASEHAYALQHTRYG